MSSNPIILFDGVCNLCNGAVKFVIKRDKGSVLKFAALQSETGLRLLKEYNLSQAGFDSFVLIENDAAYTESTAALKLCKYLIAPWPVLYGFIIVPKFIRNSFYRWVAANRYKWFGKQAQCMVPTPELKKRFLP